MSGPQVPAVKAQNKPPPKKTTSHNASSSKKRKAASSSADNDSSAPAPPPTAGPAHKKPKHKKNPTKQDATLDALLDADNSINTIFSKMDPDLLADYVAAQTKRFGDAEGLSVVELSDLYVPAAAIRDTTGTFTGEDGRQVRTKENLAGFLEANVGRAGGDDKDREKEKKRLGTAPKTNGAPHTIIVTAAGLRAADLVRAARKFQKKDNVVSKLFAKHFKLSDQVEFLEKNRTGIAVGTPARLMDLLDNGALSVEHLQRIVIDASHIDQKKRGIMDMKDTMMPLAKWLARKEFKERYGDPEKPLELLFF